MNTYRTIWNRKFSLKVVLLFHSFMGSIENKSDISIIKITHLSFLFLKKIRTKIICILLAFLMRTNTVFTCLMVGWLIDWLIAWLIEYGEVEKLKMPLI